LLQVLFFSGLAWKQLGQITTMQEGYILINVMILIS